MSVGWRRAILALVLGIVGGAAHACPSGPDHPCDIDGGRYYIALPDGADPAQARPALIWLHGLGGSGAGSLRNTAMVAPFLARGYAVIAPDGSSPDGRNRLRWNFRAGRFPDARDDSTFLGAVRDDAARRFGVDPGQVALGGFSNGAFLVHYLACANPGAFAEYLPVAGGFWRPHPVGCASGPVRLLHTHGWRDPTVPLEGRPLGGGRFLQGDIFATMEIWRAANGCADPQPDRIWAEGPFLRRQWHHCQPGGALDFALFDGGHQVPAGWADMALDWLAAQNAPGD